MNIIKLYRISNYFYKKKITVIANIIYYLQFLIFNSSIPPSTKIGRNAKVAYGGIGLVIHGKAVIGENCFIGQNITIGGKSKIYKYPKIGNNVYMAAGCRILGNIKIGNNVIIGPNSVVVKDVPDNCIVVGIPAKILKENINVADYV